MLNAVIGPTPASSTDNALVRWDGTTGRLVQDSGATLSDTGVLVLPVGGGYQLNNVAGANGEWLETAWAGNICTLKTNKQGSGSTRSLVLASGTVSALTLSNAMTYAAGGVTSALTGVHIFNSAGVAMNAAAGVQLFATLTPIFNQSGTAGYKALQVNVTETATGSGQKDLLSLEVAGGQVFRVTNAGALFMSSSIVAVGNVVAASSAAIPAGGTAGTGYRFSSTANFGMFFGSGAPTLTAAKGSLYLRSDGTGTTDRAYINTDGGTTWTAITTVA